MVASQAVGDKLLATGGARGVATLKWTGNAWRQQTYGVGCRVDVKHEISVMFGVAVGVEAQFNRQGLKLGGGRRRPLVHEAEPRSLAWDWPARPCPRVPGAGRGSCAVGRALGAPAGGSMPQGAPWGGLGEFRAVLGDAGAVTEHGGLRAARGC